MVVTLRNVKGSALTHSELDANFTTLQSETATILDSASVTSIATALDNAQSILDSADVTAIVQANGGIDSAATTALINGTYINNLVSVGMNDLTNVDISGIQNGQVLKWASGSSTFVPANDSAGGGGGGSSYTNSDVDTHLNTGTATNNQILSWTGTDYDWITGTGGASFDQNLNTTDSVEFAGLTVNGPLETTTAGTPTVTANSNLVLEAGGSVTVQKNSSNAGGGFRVASLTSTQRNALAAANGEIVYNTSTNKLQTYENNSWEDVISSATSGATFTMTANGASDYVFAADGRFFTSNTNDPVLYLRRGDTYTFVNNSGGSHPFQIRVSNGGSAYNTGVTNNGASSGNIVFTVPMSAPSTLYYQCTAHSGMGNTINIV